jgi:hypothetical protein
MCFGGHTHDLLQRPTLIETKIGGTNIAAGRASAGISWSAACSENASHVGTRFRPLEARGPMSSGQYLVPWNIHQHSGMYLFQLSQLVCVLLHLKLRNINLHNVTHSLISWNPREHMFVVQISFLTVTFFFLYHKSCHQCKPSKKSTHTLALRHVSICGVSFSSSSSSSYVTCWMLVHAYAHVAHEGCVEWTTPHH